MKRLLIAALTLLCLPAFAGRPVTKNLTLGEYTSIDAEGAISVVMNSRIATPYIEAQEEAIDLYVCEIKKGELCIRPKQRTTSLKGRVTVYLPLNTSLESVELSGASSFVADLTLTRLSFEAEGASSVELTGRVDFLDIEADGASRVTLKGSGALLTLDVEGASSINAKDWQTEACKIDISGASKSTLWVTGKLTGKLSGASSLRYKGNPQLAVDRSGASSLKSL